jgi:hypothetical protein
MVSRLVEAAISLFVRPWEGRHPTYFQETTLVPQIAFCNIRQLARCGKCAGDPRPHRVDFP